MLHKSLYLSEIENGIQQGETYSETQLHEMVREEWCEENRSLGLSLRIIIKCDAGKNTNWLSFRGMGWTFACKKALIQCLLLLDFGGEKKKFHQKE